MNHLRSEGPRVCLVALIGLFSAVATGRQALAEQINVLATLQIGPDSVLGGQVWGGGSYANTQQSSPGPIYIQGLSIPNKFVDEQHNIDTTGILKLVFSKAFVPGSSSLEHDPYVEISGKFTGNISYTSMGDMAAGYYFTATSAELKNASPSWGIPESLLEQYLNPAAYRGFGVITGGFNNYQELIIKIDDSAGAGSPVPVPEPSAWLAFGTILGGGLLRRLAGSSPSPLWGQRKLAGRSRRKVRGDRDASAE